MTAAVLRAEPPLGVPGERGPQQPGSPAESEPEARGGEGGARPLGEVPGGLPALGGEEGAREPLLDPRDGPAAAGPPGAPLVAGRLRPEPAAGGSPSSGGPGEPPPEECPICTEPYDRGRHARAPLNCRHVLCSACRSALLERAGAADLGRVRCPLCRQKTPVLEWEIRQLQEELLLLHAQPAPAPPPAPPPLPPRRPGLCGALEHHFQVRFHTGRVFGCLPCVRYPLCLVGGLGCLERRCRCCYLLSLAALLAAETLSLLLIFLPILLLVLLFLVLER